MNYIEVTFTCTPSGETISDILSALIADVGFESFVYSDNGLVAYIQESQFDKDVLIALLQSFPLEDVDVSFDSKTIIGKDWNEEWEKNYFRPLIIDNRCIIQSTFHNESAVYDYNIYIDPKMAFGTGHHQTTELMIRELLDLDIENKTLLDMGCGTAILAILASMKGANPIMAIDIDRWAYENALENIKLNKTNNIEIRMGGAELLSQTGWIYDYVLANINRNILLQDASVYSKFLQSGGFLLMSGFYDEDILSIKEECEKNNLKFINSHTKDNWAVVKFQKI